MKNQSNPEIYILAGNLYLEKIESYKRGTEEIVNEKILEEVAVKFGLKAAFLKEYLKLSRHAKTTSEKIESVGLLYEKFLKELDEYRCGYIPETELVRSYMSMSQD